jgi:hypothetical protein
MLHRTSDINGFFGTREVKILYRLSLIKKAMKEKPRGKSHLEELGVDWKIILK